MRIRGRYKLDTEQLNSFNIPHYEITGRTRWELKKNLLDYIWINHLIDIDSQMENGIMYLEADINVYTYKQLNRIMDRLKLLRSMVDTAECRILIDDIIKTLSR